MLRLKLTAFALFFPVSSQIVFSQNLPAFRWVTEVDKSGSDSFAGLGVDAQGNTYIAGSTSSAAFPVKAAVQNHLASDGLYRIDGPGSAYVELGLTSASSITVDPLNANTLYATSGGTLLRSTDGGATFSTLTVPSSSVLNLAVNPSNDQILYAGTFDKGALKSTDGGATWKPANGNLTGSANQFTTLGLWIDPAEPNILFANTAGNFVRSADSGASWQILYSSAGVVSVSFDTANPGTLYVTTYNDNDNYKSPDHGQTFTTFLAPVPLGAVLADPNHPGRLLGSTTGGILESDNGGSTWTSKLSFGALSANALFVADWANGFLYAEKAPSGIVRITSDLQTVTQVGPAAFGNINGIASANGHLYVAVTGTRDVYVAKLDPSGNVVYSTYFGGSSDDTASAMTVDPAGNVYVTGSTGSLDFPVTKGAYASAGVSFVFKLNPDGSLGYSTYFAAPPSAIAVDAAGSAYIAGTTGNGLPVTPGAYQSVCNCNPISTGFLTIFVLGGFATKFDSTGSSLMYSTYVGGTADFENVINALALASDGSMYVGSMNGIFHLNATGTALLASLQATVNPRAMALGPDGSLYLAGAPFTGLNGFQTTTGSFQPAPIGMSGLPAQVGSTPNSAVAKLDAQLKGVLAATFFGGPYDVTTVITLDAAGNVYVGGNTGPQGLPTRTPLQGGFATTDGFLSELSGDLSTLLFSSYFGDAEHFAVQGIGADSDGTVRIGGVTGLANSFGVGPMNIWVNSLALGPPPALRIDSVENAASLLDGQISAGETIVVRGAGFGSNVQLLIKGAAVPAISMTATTITAVVPQSVSLGAAEFQVQSGGARSNQVLMAVGVTSPGIFSADGSGFGQGYILNKDGTPNTPMNPAKPGDSITIYATGVGPVSFVQGYAVTGFPVNVFVDGFYCDGVAAVMGPVQGFPGSVYQITVTVPNPASLVANNPNLLNFVFPPLVGVTMQIDSASSQNGIAISIAPL